MEYLSVKNVSSRICAQEKRTWVCPNGGGIEIILSRIHT